jgi:bile-acid 7alpha-dehydratase
VTPDDLVEMEAIKHLKHRYIRCLDQKLWDELGECLVDDATSSYGGGKYSYKGRDAILAFLRESLGPSMITMHQVHQPVIELLSPSEATGSWALEDTVIMVDHNIDLRGAAYYTDRYVKVDGEWKIAHTGYKRLFEEMKPRTEGIKLTGPQ